MHPHSRGCSVLYIIVTPSSNIILAHDLGSLNGIHLLRPARRRLELAHRPDLVQTVARHADIVVALQHDLDVADVEGRIGPDLGQPAGRSDDVIHKVVGEVQNGLNVRLVCLSARSSRSRLRPPNSPLRRPASAHRLHRLQSPVGPVRRAFSC